MELNETVISSLLLPMKGFHVLLPQSMVVEITQRPELVSVDASSDEWFQGVFSWRSEQVPLIAFEALCDKPENRAHKAMRVAVIHAIHDLANLVFYAVELQAIPHHLIVRPHSLQVAPERGNDSIYVASGTLFGGHRAVIPDCEQIELVLHKRLEDSLQAHKKMVG
jgi:chemotaxis signal transduction protein